MVFLQGPFPDIWSISPAFNSLVNLQVGRGCGAAAAGADGHERDRLYK